MAKSDETKAARRQARLEAEAEEARGEARRRRVQWVASGALFVVLCVGVVFAVGSLSAGGEGDSREADADVATLPAQEITDLREAADAAECRLDSPALEGAEHEERDFEATDYDTNPPTSGPHFPQWAQDGVYAAGTEPQLGLLVHTLEHGRIDVQYKPGTSPEVVDQLEAFVAETEGYHQLLFQNPTGMEPQVAFTAWGQSLTCDAVTDRTWDAARAFREAYVDQGPESVP